MDRETRGPAADVGRPLRLRIVSRSTQLLYPSPNAGPPSHAPKPPQTYALAKPSLPTRALPSRPPPTLPPQPPRTPPPTPKQPPKPPTRDVLHARPAVNLTKTTRERLRDALECSVAWRWPACSKEAMNTSYNSDQPRFSFCECSLFSVSRFAGPLACFGRQPLRVYDG